MFHQSYLSRCREVALRNSPSRLVSQLKMSAPGCDIVVAMAQNDSPEFRKQSEDYFKVRRRLFKADRAVTGKRSVTG